MRETYRRRSTVIETFRNLAAENNVNADDWNKLLEVAKTTDAFSTTHFEAAPDGSYPACPVGQAGLYSEDISDELVDFAYAIDDMFVGVLIVRIV